MEVPSQRAARALLAALLAAALAAPAAGAPAFVPAAWSSYNAYTATGVPSKLLFPDDVSAHLFPLDLGYSVKVRRASAWRGAPRGGGAGVGACAARRRTLSGALNGARMRGAAGGPARAPCVWLAAERFGRRPGLRPTAQARRPTAHPDLPPTHQPPQESCFGPSRPAPSLQAARAPGACEYEPTGGLRAGHTRAARRPAPACLLRTGCNPGWPHGASHARSPRMHATVNLQYAETGVRVGRCASRRRAPDGSSPCRAPGPPAGPDTWRFTQKLPSEKLRLSNCYCYAGAHARERRARACAAARLDPHAGPSIDAGVARRPQRPSAPSHPRPPTRPPPAPTRLQSTALRAAGASPARAAAWASSTP